MRLGSACDLLAETQWVYAVCLSFLSDTGLTSAIRRHLPHSEDAYSLILLASSDQ